MIDSILPWPNYQVTANAGFDTRILFDFMMNGDPAAALWRSHLPPPIADTVKTYWVRYWPQALALAQSDGAKFQDWSSWCPGLVELCNLMLREHLTAKIESPLKGPWRKVLQQAGIPADRATLNLIKKMEKNAISHVGLDTLRAILSDRRKVRLMRHVPRFGQAELALIGGIPDNDISLNLLQMLKQPGVPALDDHVLDLYRNVTNLRKLLRLQPVWPYRGVKLSRQQLREAIARLEMQVTNGSTTKFDFPAPPMSGVLLDGFVIEPLTSIDAIVLEAEQMQNCLKVYIPQILSGQHFAYRMLEPERCSVLLIGKAKNWEPMEIRAYNNENPEDETVRLILNWCSCYPSAGTLNPPIVPF